MPILKLSSKHQHKLVKLSALCWRGKRRQVLPLHYGEESRAWSRILQVVPCARLCKCQLKILLALCTHQQIFREVEVEQMKNFHITLVRESGMLRSVCNWEGTIQEQQWRNYRMGCELLKHWNACSCVCSWSCKNPYFFSESKIFLAFEEQR